MSKLEKSMIHFIVAEDSRKLQEDYKFYFMELGIKNYSIFPSGRDALEYFQSLVHKKNVVFISDLHMPVMSGEQLLMCVRKDCFENQIPFLLATAECDLNKLLDLAELGAKHYIRKPITLNSFGRKLNEILGYF